MSGTFYWETGAKKCRKRFLTPFQAPFQAPAVLSPPNASASLGTFKWEFRELIAVEEPLQHYGGWVPVNRGTQTANTLVVREDVPIRGQYKVTVNSCGETSFKILSVFVNAAYPVNFRKLAGPTPGLKHLQTFYTWDSSSGRFEDLDGVRIGEYVWFTQVKRFLVQPLYYPNPVPYPYPFPFIGSDQDGVYKPSQTGEPADQISPVFGIPIIQDDNGEGLKVGFPGAGTVGPFEFTAHQVFWYQVTDDTRRIVRDTKLPMQRYDIRYRLFRGGPTGWQYSIRKAPDQMITFDIGGFPWPSQ